MRIARDGDSTINQGSDKGPDEARYRLRPTAHDLQAECQTVDVWAIVCDDAKSQYNETEFSKAAERWYKHCSEKAADAGVLVACGVDVGRVGDDGGCDCKTKHFREAEGENQAGRGPSKDSDAIDATGLVDCIVRCVTCPTYGFIHQ